MQLCPASSFNAKCEIFEKRQVHTVCQAVIVEWKPSLMIISSKVFVVVFKDRYIILFHELSAALLLIDYTHVQVIS